MITIIGSVLIFLGSLFMFIAAIGLFRLKTLYLKLHATTKVGTLGSGLILLGVGIQIKGSHNITEIILLILFIAITNPISAHLLGKLYFLGKMHDS